MIKPLYALVDIDEVISDTNAILLDEFNRAFKKSFTLDDWKHFDVCSLYGMTAQQYYQISDNSNAILRARPCNGALEALTILQSNNIHPLLVTARRPHGIDPISTVKWLQKHDIDYLPLHLLGDNCKAELARSIPDVIASFDDGAHNVEKYLSIGNAHHFIIDKPWNESFSDSRAIRVPSLYDGTIKLITELL